MGGESAGGNLAAALLLKVREEDLPQPAGLYLQSPWLDMDTVGESYDTVGDRDPIISQDGMEMYAATFLAGRPDDLFTSPVRADLHGFPPILIQVGTEEVLLSDSLNFANQAALSGLNVKLDVWRYVPHAWPLFPIQINNTKGNRSPNELAIAQFGLGSLSQCAATRNDSLFN